MKVLFEIPLSPLEFEKSNFNWLANRCNWLFIIEDVKRIRTFSIESEPAKELQVATLVDKKKCTGLSWNYNSTLLALVVDSRQIYLWELQTNQFTIFKPEARSSNHNAASKRIKLGDIEAVAWSRVTNKLAFGYSTGKLLLCDLTGPKLEETLIDNSEGLLGRVVSIEGSKHLDLLVCLTNISEVLVMSFDGHVRFYILIEQANLVQAKFSEPMGYSGPSSGAQSERSIWLACQLAGDRLMIKKISLTGIRPEEAKTRSDMDVVYDGNRSDDYDGREDRKDNLINFHWLDTTNLIACYSSGLVILLQIKTRATNDRQAPTSYFLTTSMILNLAAVEGNNENLTNDDIEEGDCGFRSFELMSCGSPKTDDQSTVESFSMIALTNYRLFYYELFKLESDDTMYTFEKVDDLDLTSSLKLKGLRLERVRWSFDCSMLAIQLTNAHILVYRTRLYNYLVASNGPKTAYLSDSREVTILDYGTTRFHRADETNHTDEESSMIDETEGSIGESSNKALTVMLDMKPSVIAIGPKHLAVGLNNRVWFYQTASGLFSYLNHEAQLIDEQEYASVVLNIQLSSRFVAVLLNNGQLKLHAIQSSLQAAQKSAGSLELPSNQAELDKHEYYTDDLDTGERHLLDDERFFPDPSSPDEQISAFILTEELFIYTTKDYCLHVFSLKNWTLVQSYEHSGCFKNNESPIKKLIGNERGNKFVCLAEESRSMNNSNVCLYDLYSNKMIEFFKGSLYAKIFKSQLAITMADQRRVAMKPSDLSLDKPKLNRTMGAIWDKDGRTVHLLSGRYIYSTVVLNHTLEKEVEVVIIEHVATVCKPHSYKALYASNGIMSFQTSLGRVINLVLESHDDELKLAKLKSEIESLRVPNEGLNGCALQLEVMRRKIIYFRQILSIHSLSKCKEIAEYLMSGDFEQRSDSSGVVDQVLWRQLAARALFTLNLNYALMIYRKYGLLVFAKVLDDILADSRRKGSDSRCAIRTRLLVLLDCEVVNEED